MPKKVVRITESELRGFIIKVINENNELMEYDEYNYPAGADADSRAPWHEDSDPYENYEEYVILNDGLSVDDFNVRLYSSSYTATNSLYNILRDVRADEEICEYFDDALVNPDMRNSDDFKRRLDALLDTWAKDCAEWEYEDSNEPNYDEDRDD
jgi:hypothetical protein